MRFLIRSVAALLLLAGLVMLAGWALPSTRDGRAETVIAAPPARIVEAVADVEAQTGWRQGISAIERTAEGWTEVTARGARRSVTMAEKKRPTN